mgnify:CR=1 FL=1
MNVIVVGGGKVGRKLVEDFNYEGDDVVLIDIKSEICDRIQDDYDVRCVCGSGTDLETLREVLLNPLKIEELKHQGMKFIRKHHDYVKVSNMYIDVYKSLLQ